ANDVQTVTIANAIGGTFSLSFNGQSATGIAYNVSASTLQADLQGLSTIGSGNVTVTETSPNSNTNIYTITFTGTTGTLAGISQPSFTINSLSLTSLVGAPASMGVSTVNPGGLAGSGTTVENGAALQMAGGVTETGEQLVLFGGGVSSTGALSGDANSNAWNGQIVLSSSSTVNVGSGGMLAIGDAISGSNSLTKIGTGTLEYTGVNPNTYSGNTAVDDGTLLLNKTAGATAIAGSLTIGNDVGPGSDQVQVGTAEQIASSSAVTMASTGVLQLLSSVATSTTQAEQTVTVAGSSGNFTLTFNSYTTPSIPFNASTATVQTDLQNLTSIGSGNVSVTGTPGNYVVLFTSTLANAAEPQMSIAIVSGSSIGTDKVNVISTGGELGQQTIGALTTTSGVSASSSISLASGTTLALNGSVTVNTGIAGSSAAAPSVTISGGTLALAPQGSATGRTFTVNQSPMPVNLVISSTIANGVSGAASGLTKAGTGRMVLNPTSGSNTFTGAVTVSAGELNLQQSGALDAVSGTSVTSGAALEMTTSVTSSAWLTLNGTGINNTGALLDTSGNDTWTGNIALASASNVGAASGTTLTISGVISGAGALTKILPGTLVFGGSTANTNTGTTTVAEGTLLLSKPSGIDAIAAGGSLTVGNDAGGADSDLAQLTAAGEIDPGDSVTIDSTGQLDLNGFNQTLTNVTMEFGPTQSGLLSTESGTLSLTGSLTDNLTFNSIGTVATGGPAATISGNLALGSSSITHTFTVNTGTALDNALISATITGTGTVTKSGVGTLALSANNTSGWSSPITLNGGTVALGNSGALGTGTLSVAAATTLRGDGTAITLANNITFSGSFTLTIGGTQNFTLSDTINAYSSASSTLSVASAGSTSVGNIVTASGETFFIDTNFYSNATLAGTVSGSGNFEKANLGLLTVGATGVFNLTTSVFIFDGVLAVSNSSAFNSTANIEPSSGGALDISGNQTFTNKLTLYNESTIDSGSVGFLTGALRSTSGNNTWGGNVVLAGVSAAVNYIGVDSGLLTINGTISESATGSGLAKVGAGTLVLGGSSSNTYTGLTTVYQGTLQLNKSGSANAIDSGGVTVGDGGDGHDSDVLQWGPASGTAELGSTVSVTVGSTGLLNMSTYSVSATIYNLTMNTASVSSADVQTGSALLTIGASEFLAVNSSGATDANSPAATISGNLSLGTGAIFDVSSSLVPSTADDLVVSAATSGNGQGDGIALEVIGGGTMALTAANTYSGTTDVLSSTTLALSGGGTDPNTQMWIQTGSTLLLDNQSAAALNNRLGSSVEVLLSGGTFDYLGAPGAASSESIGTLQITGTDSVIESTVSTTPGSSVTITAASLYQAATSGIYRFAGIGADLGSASNQLLFTATPTLTGGIIPDAVLEDSSGVDFASYGVSGIAPASYVTSLTGAGPTSNVKLSSNQTLSSPQTVNAILFAGPNVAVNVGANTLSVASGAIAIEASGDAISGGTLALGTEGILDAESGDNLTISSGITGGSGLLKTGAGTLTLTGNNGYTNETWVNAGVLNVQNGLALGPSGNTTDVLSGAGLQVQGNISVAGSLVLAGTGPSSNGAGALQNVSGTNTWVGSVTASGGGDVGVTNGQLTLNGAVTSGALVQVGTGILQIAGSVANTTLNLTVNSGTLELNDSAGSALNGVLKVGDGVGTAQVVMMAASQFSSTSSIAVVNTGAINLAGYSQTLTSLNINDGSVINSGSGGTLTLTSGTFPVAFVGGTLNTGSGTLALTGLNATIAVNT
ncbi:MAG TPA: autotransporter-associated beta strand repeat-containing protein, partial [Pirellulales bacterium]